MKKFACPKLIKVRKSICFGYVRHYMLKETNYFKKDVAEKSSGNLDLETKLSQPKQFTQT